jgi:NitT/TauT family transport system substrate-binding protein
VAAFQRKFGGKAMIKTLVAWFAPLVVVFLTAFSAQGQAPVRSPEKVQIAHALTLINLPMYVAQDTGEFAKEGLEVQFVLLTGGTEAATALLSRSVDFVATSIDKVAFLREKGQENVKAIVGLQSQPTQGLVLRTDLKDKFPRADIKSLAGKGLRLGISTPGSGTDVGLRTLLKYYGVDPDKDVQIISTRGQTDVAIAALAQGSVDGFFFPEPAPALAVRQGIGFRFLDYGKEGPEALRLIAYNALLTRDDVIDKRPELVAKIVRAIARAEKSMASNPSIAVPAAQNIISKQLGADAIMTIVAEGVPYFKAEIPTRNVEILVKALLDSGQIKKAYSYGDLVSTKFADQWNP